MTTATDVVTAAQAACDTAEQFGSSNGWSGVTRVQAVAAASQLDAANAQIATLTSANTQLTSDKAALSAHIATLGTDIDAILVATQKAKADE